MDFSEFKKLLTEANDKGNLITSKHDPNQIDKTFRKIKRSVISHELTNNIEDFINSEQYSVEVYFNNNYPSTPYFFHIEPYPGVLNTVAASGITGNMVTSTLDSLVVVSGVSQGIHMYGIDSYDVLQMEASGRLVYINQIKY